MTKTEHRVSVENGKYTFVVPADDYRVSILRYGEPWHGPQGEASNALHQIMMELDAARVVLEAARALVRRYEGGVAYPAILADALDLHDRLVSDRETPSPWAGSVLAQYAARAAEEQRAKDWTPPSQRVPEPGPCTPMAHHWVSGSAVCQCGEATRTGDCRFWYVASRLTGAQIYEAITGQPKPTRHWPDCATNHGGAKCDMGPECGTEEPQP